MFEALYALFLRSTASGPAPVIRNADPDGDHDDRVVPRTRLSLRDAASRMCRDRRRRAGTDPNRHERRSRPGKTDIDAHRREYRPSFRLSLGNALRKSKTSVGRWGTAISSRRI